MLKLKNLFLVFQKVFLDARSKLGITVGKFQEKKLNWQKYNFIVAFGKWKIFQSRLPRAS